VVAKTIPYPDNCLQVTRVLCLLGATDIELAKAFSVSPSTWKTWVRAHPDLAEAVLDGRERADAAVAASLYHRARGYSHPDEMIVFTDKRAGEFKKIPITRHYAPEVAACIFWLKNRQPALWRDRIERAAGEGGSDESVPEQRKRAAKELRLWREDTAA